MPETDLHKAARDGELDEIERLLAEGLNVNEKGAQGRTALHRALGGGFAECAALLIEKGADPNQADSLKRTSLHWAAMGPPPGNVECCKLIFDKGDGEGMLKMATSKSGSTPLHSAAGTNRPEVVQFLVDKGADQTAKDDDELTAYDLAKQSGYTEVLSFLTPPSGGGSGEGGGGCCSVQ